MVTRVEQGKHTAEHQAAIPETPPVETPKVKSVASEKFEQMEKIERHWIYTVRLGTGGAVLANIALLAATIYATKWMVKY